MKSVSVFCGSSCGTSHRVIDLAKQLGAEIAKADIDLVYGAAKIGLMGIVADAVIKNGGRTIGVIPQFLKTKEVVHQALSELIVTDTMHQRKELMYEKSDGFVVIPGGLGTMDEFFEILTWGQLGLHRKPIAILNVDGFYDAMLQQLEKMVELGFVKVDNMDSLIVENDVKQLLSAMHRFNPA